MTDELVFYTNPQSRGRTVYCGAQIGFGMQFGSIEKRPAFEAYWTRLANRPARLKAEEQDGPFG